MVSNCPFLVGSISVVKMNVLPRLLFLLQMIPYGIPKGFYTIVRSLIDKYVWNRKCPRLARTLFTRPKREGGLALTDFKRYVMAIVFNRISDWKYHRL